MYMKAFISLSEEHLAKCRTNLYGPSGKGVIFIIYVRGVAKSIPSHRAKIMILVIEC